MVQYTFVGYFAEVDDASGHLPAIVDAGSLFILEVVVDTATPSEPIPAGFPATFGRYYDAIQSWWFATPLGVLDTGDFPSSSLEGVLVADDSSDGLGVTLGEVNGLSLSVAFIGSPGVFASDDLPTTPGPLDMSGALGAVRMQHVGSGDYQSPEASATGELLLVEVSEVPAPGALALAGLVFVGARRRRR
jgi:MYXO-CTERM domain-containing protein